MPPKAAPTKGPVAPPKPVLPPVNTSVWSADSVFPAKEGLAAFAPTGALLTDMLTYSLLAGIPPHPKLFKKRPTASSDTDGAAPATGDADVDLNTRYVLDRVTDTFTLQNWRLDLGTFAALKASLPACTTLSTLKFSGCALLPSMLAELAVVLKQCPKVASLFLDYNTLPAASSASSSSTSSSSSPPGSAAADSKETEDTKEEEKEQDDHASGAAQGSSTSQETLADALALFVDNGLSISLLSLRGNDLGVDGASKIAAKLRTNTTLTALVLAGNHLGAAGLTALVPALRDNRTLQQLSLAQNDLDATSVPLLVSSFTAYTLTDDEAAARKALDDSLVAALPPVAEEPVKAGGKPAAGKPPVPAPAVATPAPRRVLPLVARHATSGLWTGLGHYNLKTLDLAGNVLGDAGVPLVARGLAISRAEAAAHAASAVPAEDARKSPALGKAPSPRPKTGSGAGAGAGVAGAAVSLEDQLAAGSLVTAAVKPKALKVNVAWNQATAATCELLTMEYGAGETGAAAGVVFC